MKFHKLLHGLADIHVFGIEPNDRHWEGSFTEGNGTEPLLTMGDAVNKYGYPSPCAYQMEQRVDLVDFQLGLQLYSFLVCQTVKHSSGIHTTGWRTDIIVGQLA